MDAFLTFTKALTQLLYFFTLLIIVALVVKNYRSIISTLLPRLRSLKCPIMELEFANSAIRSAVELAQKSPEWNVQVSEEERTQAIERARKNIDLFGNTNLLWVDDRPENNLNEQRMFRSLGVSIDNAASTEKALRMLSIAPYDVIITDMMREGDPEAGLTFLQHKKTNPNIIAKNRTTPAIIYLGNYDEKKGVPANAFGITNRTDNLLHLVIDALQRKAP
jgi:CheY-like chemotaxis protein